jgi:hypothetical protein
VLTIVGLRLLSPLVHGSIAIAEISHDRGNPGSRRAHPAGVIIASSKASILFSLLLCFASAPGQTDHLVNAGVEAGTFGSSPSFARVNDQSGCTYASGVEQGSTF